MKRKLLSWSVAVLLFAAAVFGWNQSSQAALCSKCRELMFVDSDGKCSDCGGRTASGALQLCPKCSAKRHQCEHCLALLTEKDESAPESKPGDAAAEKSHGDDAQDRPPLVWTTPANGSNSARPEEAPAAKPTDSEITLLPPAANVEKPMPLESLPQSKAPVELPPEPIAHAKPKPINPAKAGTYTAGKWRYQMQITGPGSRSEGRWGWLTYDGQKLPRGDVNDYYITPWGPMYWVDVPTTAWGLHGWMPAPLAQNRRQGRTLTLPSSILGPAPTQSGVVAARLPVPPAAAETASPTGPRPQTLEINRSHNGQLARVHVGNVLVIRLPGNPASGYRWQAASTTSPVVRMTVRPQYSPPASSAAAAAGMYTFTFQAVQPGAGSIRLYYVNPNDPGRPRDSFTVGVNVAPPSTARADLPVYGQGSGR